MPKKYHCTQTVAKNIVAFLFFLAAISLFYDIHRKDTAFAQDTQNVTSASKPEMAGNSDSFIKKAEKTSLIREGTVMQSQHVVFRVSNNLVVLTTANGSERFTCLQNLNLQRVTDVLRDNPTLTDWTVDFIVTEYRGENYALIQRAVLSSTAQRTSDPK